MVVYSSLGAKILRFARFFPSASEGQNDWGNEEKTILDEAQYSISPFGCYLVDKYNSWSGRQQLTDLDGSEHRNILYLMAITKPRFSL